MSTLTIDLVTVTTNAHVPLVALLGERGAFMFEQTIFRIADDMVDDYYGGSWTMRYGPGVLAWSPPPDADGTLTLRSPNGAVAKLPEIDAGIVLTLFALSHASFMRGAPDTLAETYHRVREHLWYRSSNVTPMAKLLD